MKVSFTGVRSVGTSAFNNFIPTKQVLMTKTTNVVIPSTIEHEETKKTESNFYKYATATAAVIGAAVGMGYLIKRKASPEDGLAPIKKMYNNIVSKFPQDEPYYKTLAKALGLQSGEEYRLTPIVGEHQLTDILQKASPIDFEVGQNLEGIKNRTLRINLHNHTTASDGKMSPAEMLEQARKWADEIASKKTDDKPPFVFAVTDHDTMDGAKEMLQIISQEPAKYKNLKLVLGGEFSVSHTNPTDVKSPMNFELIGYGLNPFNEGMNKFLTKLKNDRAKVTEEFIGKVKEKYPQYDLNMDDTKEFHANIRNMRTNGVLYLTREYLIHKIMFTEYVNEINQKIIPENAEKLDATALFRKAKDEFYVKKDAKELQGEGITQFQRDAILRPILEEKGYLSDDNQNVFNQIFQKDFTEQRNFVENLLKQWLPKLDDNRGYLIRHEEFFNAVRDSKCEGIFGVAHPGLINASMFSDDVQRVCNEKGYDKGQHLAWRLYSALKTSGGDKFKVTEANYQSYPTDAGSRAWQKYMGEDKAKEFNLLKAGGIDCHKPSIFKKHAYLTQDEIKNNNLEGIV